MISRAFSSLSENGRMSTFSYLLATSVDAQFVLPTTQLIFSDEKNFLYNSKMLVTIVNEYIALHWSAVGLPI